MTLWFVFLLWAQPPQRPAPEHIATAAGVGEAEALCSARLEEASRDPESLARDCRQAEALFRKSLEQHPEAPAALLGLGRSLIGLGRPAEAIPYLKKLAKVTPDDRMAKVTLGRAYGQALGFGYEKPEQFFEAEDLLRSLVESDPKDAESWYYLGVLCYKYRYYQSALDALNQAERLRPGHPGVLFYRAVSLAHLGSTGAAEKEFRALLSHPQASNNSAVLLGYAEFLYDTQRPEMALSAVDQSLRSAPESCPGHFWKARILLRMGQPEQAATEAERAVKIAPELPNPRNLLMKIYRALGKQDEANQQAAWLDEYENTKTH
jgi:tetratricopeptide (TPR) repeat protein